MERESVTAIISPGEEHHLPDIINAAKRRGTPYARSHEISLVRWGYGKHQRYIAATLTDSTRVLGVDIEDNPPWASALTKRPAVIVQPEQVLQVIGSEAVYLADGHGITFSNVSEKSSNRTLRLFDVRLHVLCHGAEFDLKTRRPGYPAIGQQQAALRQDPKAEDAIREESLLPARRLL